MRYLAGNSWAAITDPSVVKRVRRLQVERALPLDLWARMRATLAERSELQRPSEPRWRAARALLLVMGDGGLRIAEAAAVTRALERSRAGLRYDDRGAGFAADCAASGAAHAASAREVRCTRRR
ncbi:hypothetical protein AQ914_21700 [Burkholderia pseudomallei]|uniref:hypothetical protein n=1 Tax=Burkholderia pseudomallei TaxID=28450 RepID=UPI000977B2D7|nr:hypothetical protein [Burkholderia pseudomallei]ONC38152.1 hypothetical protein AQ914_21700 [Burkholderia pseudomallei]